MATSERLRTRSTAHYDGTRPAPDEAYIEPAAASRSEAAAASGLNVLAGIWLIISPFVLGYTGADGTWNPIVFGAIVGLAALARLGAGLRGEWLSWLNVAIGIWLFISAFWLASSSQASWNVGIMGVVVFVLGAWSASVEPR